MADEKEVVRRTEFGVLIRQDPGVDGNLPIHWVEVGVVEAGSGDQAKRIAAEKHGPGEYVAVAARWWKPEVFEREVVTKLVARPAGQTSVLEALDATTTTEEE